MSFDAVFLDLVDTLTAFPKKPIRAVAEHFHLKGVDVLDEIAISITQEMPGLSSEMFFCILAERCKDAGLFVESEVGELASVWGDALEAAFLLNGAFALLDDIRRRGERIGIISNSLPPAWRMIRKFGFDLYADTIVLSCDIGYWKPDQEIFCHALEKIDGARPERCLMIGNKVSTDMLGAAASGIRGILLDSNSSAISVRAVGGHRFAVAPTLRDCLAAASML